MRAYQNYFHPWKSILVFEAKLIDKDLSLMLFFQVKTSDTDEKNTQEDSEVPVDAESAVETTVTIPDSAAGNQDDECPADLSLLTCDSEKDNEEEDQAKPLGTSGDLENNRDRVEAVEVHGQEE